MIPAPVAPRTAKTTACRVCPEPRKRTTHAIRLLGLYPVKIALKDGTHISVDGGWAVSDG